jgi:hypothetical protein
LDPWEAALKSWVRILPGPDRSSSRARMARPDRAILPDLSEAFAGKKKRRWNCLDDAGELRAWRNGELLSRAARVQRRISRLPVKADRGFSRRQRAGGGTVMKRNGEEKVNEEL